MWSVTWQATSAGRPSRTNHLTGVPAALGALTALETLIMCGNNLGSVPAVGTDGQFRHVIKRILNPRFLSQMASYDAASTIPRWIVLATSSNAFEPSFLELNEILWRVEHYPSFIELHGII